MPQSRWSRYAPVVVGALLMLEAALLLAVGMITAIIGSLVGMLAFVAGAGDATEKQVAQGFAMIGVTLASPFVLAGLISFAGLFLILGRKKGLVIAVSILALAAQAGFHRLLEEPFSAGALVPVVLHVLAIVMAVVFIPAPTARPASA